MYADRYGAGPRIKPGSMTLALATTALPIAMLVVGLQITQSRQIDKIIKTFDVRNDPPPPPDPVKPDVKPDVQKQILETPVVPPVQPPVKSPNTILTTEIVPPPGPVMPIVDPGLGNGGGLIEVPKPAVIVGAEIDSRYRNLLQPPYPAEEQRAGRSGRVSLRVLVGADGRVKQVTKLSADSDAFYSAAERQALNKWRFKPATRDGVAIEQWKVMNLRFEINDQE